MKHPGTWLIWATCAGLIAFSTTNPFYLSAVVAVCRVVFAVHSPRGSRRGFRRLLLIAAVTVALRTALVLFGTIDPSNLAFSALEGMRLAVLLVVFGTFNAVADTHALLRLAPRRFHEPALAAALALSMAPRTISAAGRVREAQQMRGIGTRKWRSLPALAVPVLQTGMEEALTLAESMDSRGHGRGRRTSYRPQPWGLSSTAVAATAIAAATVFLGAAFRGLGSMNPPTDPLLMPHVDPRLVIAIVLLALPACFRREAL